MKKEEFEKKVENWAVEFINADEELSLIETFKNQNISRMSHPILDKMESSKLCDFNCDFVFLVESKASGYQLMLVNRYVKSIGIKDIGEMLVYAKIAKPIYAFLISVSGHSTEINNILVSEKISNPLFKYDTNKSIILFALKDTIKKESVLPVNVRDFFYRKIGLV